MMSGVKDEPRKLSRRVRAQQTRQRIVESALNAFTERGYAATTMESVAVDAGVAVQTVYFTFRTKGDLLQAAYEHVVFGPEQTPPHLTDWWHAVEAEPDVGAAIRVLVEGTLAVLERAAPLVWAVLGDDTAREGYQHNEGLRRDGTTQLIQILARKHALLPGLSPERARDVLLLLTGPVLYSHLARDMGWDRAEVEQWVVATVGQQLFGIDTAQPAGTSGCNDPSVPVSMHCPRCRYLLAADDPEALADDMVAHLRAAHGHEPPREHVLARIAHLGQDEGNR